MDALVDELPTTGDLALRSPLAFVADTTPVPVAGADVHDPPEVAVLDDALRLQE